MLKIWDTYRHAVRASFGDLARADEGLAFWRDYLFLSTITYVLPLSLIALIPGVAAALINHFYGIAIFDTLAVIALFTIAFARRLSSTIRKVIFIFIAYGLAIVFLNTLGYYGPSLVYLLGIAIFMILIFPKNYAWLSLAINVAFCLGYALAIHFRTIQIENQSVLSWVAISANLIFLNALFSVLIPRLFAGMQASLEEQKNLKEKLNEQQAHLKEMYSRTERKNEELEQFAYVASHDLQEPLRMVTSFLTLLERNYKTQLDDRAKGYIHFAVDGAKRMRQIILDLLEYSRADRPEETMEAVDFNELIQEVRALQRRLIEEKSASLIVHPLPRLKCYRSGMLRIFQNLVGNALKYSKIDVPPAIEISAFEGPDYWTFAVKDNGIGIDPKFFEKIFVMFQRLHSSQEYGGTGIGLSIVQKIILNHRGKIWLESTSGQGSTFYFTLPR